MRWANSVLCFILDGHQASTAAPLAAAKKEKKEVMSKRAKRRMADRTSMFYDTKYFNCHGTLLKL